MFYHIQIDYFCTEKQKQVLLTETNITDIEDMRKRIVDPYTFGHSFKFQGTDIFLASIHSFNIYESETSITTDIIDMPLHNTPYNLVDVTNKMAIQ